MTIVTKVSKGNTIWGFNHIRMFAVTIGLNDDGAMGIGFKAKGDLSIETGTAELIGGLGQVKAYEKRGKEKSGFVNREHWILV